MEVQTAFRLVASTAKARPRKPPPPTTTTRMRSTRSRQKFLAAPDELLGSDLVIISAPDIEPVARGPVARDTLAGVLHSQHEFRDVQPLAWSNELQSRPRERIHAHRNAEAE